VARLISWGEEYFGGSTNLKIGGVGRLAEREMEVTPNATHHPSPVCNGSRVCPPGPWAMGIASINVHRYLQNSVHISICTLQKRFVFYVIKNWSEVSDRNNQSINQNNSFICFIGNGKMFAWTPCEQPVRRSSESLFHGRMLALFE
jgi:hypothetical protein